MLQQSVPDTTINITQSTQTNTVWQGILEFYTATVNKPNQKITHALPCNFSSVLTNDQPEVNSKNWPSRLRMQLIPRQRIANPNFFNVLKTGSSVVLIRFNHGSEFLCKLMNSHLVGYIQFPMNCDKMFVLYMPDEKKFMGFIPNNQHGIFHKTKQISEDHRKQQQKNDVATTLTNENKRKSQQSADISPALIDLGIIEENSYESESIFPEKKRSRKESVESNDLNEQSLLNISAEETQIQSSFEDDHQKELQVKVAQDQQQEEKQQQQQNIIDRLYIIKEQLQRTLHDEQMKEIQVKLAKWRRQEKEQQQQQRIIDRMNVINQQVQQILEDVQQEELQVEVAQELQQQKKQQQQQRIIVRMNAINQQVQQILEDEQQEELQVEVSQELQQQEEQQQQHHIINGLNAIKEQVQQILEDEQKKELQVKAAQEQQQQQQQIMDRQALKQMQEELQKQQQQLDQIIAERLTQQQQVADEQDFKTKTEAKLKDLMRDNTELMRDNTYLKDQVQYLKGKVKSREEEVASANQKVPEMQVFIEEFMQSVENANKIAGERWKQLSQ